MFRVFKIVLTCLVFFFVFLGFIFWELFWGYNFFLKDVGQILLRKDHSVELRLENNKIARTKPPKFYHTLEQLPQYTIDFLIFQEDQNFFEHSGYSLRNIFIVLYDHIFKGDRLRGASTLTQQLVRSLFIDREPSFRRKLIELRLARAMEQHLNKKQILELYFNYVYWGKGGNGIGAASRIYFKKQPQFLSIRQSIFLVSLLPYPASCYNLKQCRNEGVLRRMNRLERWYLKDK